MSQIVTRIPYVYRDGNNYKQTSYIYLVGTLTEKDLQAIASKLNDGDGFIPFDLGLGIPELQGLMSDFPSDSDHVYHDLELDSLELLPRAPEGERVIEVADFVAAFEAIEDAESWLEDLSMFRLGIPGALERPQPQGELQSFRVLGAHANRNFFVLTVQASSAQAAFGAAALQLKEADEEGDAEFYGAVPADVEVELPGDSVVTLDTVLDPEQADVFGLNA